MIRPASASRLPTLGITRRLFSILPAANVELLAALALAALYLAVMSGHLHSIDGLITYRQAESLAFEGSLKWSQPLWLEAPWTTSKYGIGLSLLYVPGLLIWSWLHPYAPMSGAQPFDKALYYDDPYYALAAAPVHIVITVAAAYLVALVCRELGLGKGGALWGLALYGLGSPAIIYSRGDWGQQLEGLCWIAAIYGMLRFRRTANLGPLIFCSIAVCYSLLTRPLEGVLLSATIFALVVPGMHFWRWPVRAWRALAIVGAGFAAGVAITLLVNLLRYGSPLDFGYVGEGWTTPLGVGLTGALVSPARGLLWQFPAVLLAPLGMLWLWRRGRRTLSLALAGLACAQLVNVAAWMWWWGGWNFGLRLFIPALPILAVLAASGIKALPAGARNWIPGLLLMAGLAWAVPCVLTDLAGGYGETYNGTVESFRWDAYPPVGAWTFLHHLYATSSLDTNSIDIVWFRLAREAGNLSLLPMLALLAIAAALATRVLFSLRAFDGGIAMRSQNPINTSSPIPSPEMEIVRK
ncbi:MAG TPA: hypothetical protein VJ183_04060 [Chloroflexia bacterium]|nr:hypothetical protein [Chloroflexia bacterium]